MTTDERLGMPLSKRSLRAMHDRWQHDLNRLQAAYPVEGWNADHPSLEAIRNLATAVAQVRFMLVPTIGANHDHHRARTASSTREA
jgi:hypothetical protein